MTHKFKKVDIPDGKSSVVEVCICGARSIRCRGGHRRYIDAYGDVVVHATDCSREGPVKPAKRQKREKTRLTKRELQIARLLSDGLSSKAIAGVLGISHKTTEVHRHNILTALRAHSAAHAMAILFRKGILKVDYDNTATDNGSSAEEKIPAAK